MSHLYFTGQRLRGGVALKHITRARASLKRRYWDFHEHAFEQLRAVYGADGGVRDRLQQQPVLL